MSSARPATSATAKPNPTKNLAREAVEVVLLVAVIFFAIKLSVESRPIDGISMLPTLQDQQTVLVNKLAYVFGVPQRGDVIIFYAPPAARELCPDENGTLAPDTVFVKRIIGIPGDTISLTPKTVAVDGHVLTEPYILRPINPGTQTVHLGPDQYWAMGDDRPNSCDARYWGTLDRKYIIGKAEFVFWPLKEFQMIPTDPQVFQGISDRQQTPAPSPASALVAAPLIALATRGFRHKRATQQPKRRAA